MLSPLNLAFFKVDPSPFDPIPKRWRFDPWHRRPIRPISVHPPDFRPVFLQLFNNSLVKNRFSIGLLIGSFFSRSVIAFDCHGLVFMLHFFLGFSSLFGDTWCSIFCDVFHLVLYFCDIFLRSFFSVIAAESRLTFSENNVSCRSRCAPYVSHSGEFLLRKFHLMSIFRSIHFVSIECPILKYSPMIDGTFVLEFQTVFEK